MPSARQGLFDVGTWLPALEKFGAVTHLTVTVYAQDGIVCGPVHSTPLFELFGRHGYEPGILRECARTCLAQAVDRPAVVVAPQYGLAVVGTSLVLDGEVVGAAVAGYALVDFVRSAAIDQLAREAGVPVGDLWEIARTFQPMPERRLVQQGELLQVLGDVVLRESSRTRRSEAMVTELTDESVARDDFLAVLSHELRTPLTPIRAWARILKLGGADSRTQRAAEVIERNAVLQTRLVDDLIELNRANRGKLTLHPTPHDLNELLGSALEAIREDAREKEIALEVVEAGEPLLAHADGDRVEQIFRNVLTNAVRFTPKGGRISVLMTRDADAAIVRVRDTGEGIAPEFLRHAFEPFRQEERGTRRRHSGLGIGLALVKQLTELHGGRVTLASEGVGSGTEVTIRLPLLTGVLDAPVAPVAEPTPDLTGVRLLLIDDAADTREAARMLLEDIGAEVHVARDGVEALDLARSTDLDVVLCDLRMPRMDGYEFIRALRTGSDRGPAVIAMSGFASSADHLRTEAAGFDGHVDKPFDERRLATAIETALSHRERAP